MSERGSSSKHDSPRRSSGKKGDKNGSKEHSSKLQADKEDSTKVPHVRAVQPAAGASTSQQAPAPVVCEPSTSDKLDSLTQLLSGFINNFTHSHSDTTAHASGTAHRAHDISLSDGEITDSDYAGNDPLDCLDDVVSPAQPNCLDQSDFQKALEDLAGSFHGEDEKGEALSDKLAAILNASLRRRPSDDSVKATSAKIKLPINVDNLKVPVTNSDITQAMNAGGKFLDARLTRTNCLISKAIVPVANLISDLGERKNRPTDFYLASLNDSLRLLAAAFNYLNHIRKEVARIHVNDSALTHLTTWECEVGTNELFPFDVAKKCDEIHKTKKLGRPQYKQKTNLQPRRFKPYYNKRQVDKQLHQGYSQSRYNPKPGFGHKQPQGRKPFNRASR